MTHFVYADCCVLCGDALAPDSPCLCVECQKRARQQTQKLERLAPPGGTGQADVKKLVERIGREGG